MHNTMLFGLKPDVVKKIRSVIDHIDRIGTVFYRRIPERSAGASLIPRSGGASSGLKSQKSLRSKV